MAAIRGQYILPSLRIDFKLSDNGRFGPYLSSNVMAAFPFACVACFASTEVSEHFEYRDGISRKSPRQMLSLVA